MSLEMGPNMKDTNQISMEMLYQKDITDYIKRSKYFKQKLCKSYTVLWYFCNKHLQNWINKNVNYEANIQDNTIDLFNSIKIFMRKPEFLKYISMSIT